MWMLWQQNLEFEVVLMWITLKNYAFLSVCILVISGQCDQRAITMYGLWIGGLYQSGLLCKCRMVILDMQDICISRMTILDMQDILDIQDGHPEFARHMNIQDDHPGCAGHIAYAGWSSWICRSCNMDIQDGYSTIYLIYMYWYKKN